MTLPKKLDPVVQKFVDDWRATRRPDRPWISDLITEITESLLQNPAQYYQCADLVNYFEAIPQVVSQIKDIAAEKLGAAELRDERLLRVDLQEDWSINAEVERNPPYHIAISTSLYRYCARLSELLIAGLALDATAESASRQVRPVLTRTEVVTRIRTLLENFLNQNTVPAERLPLSPEHTGLRDVTFYAIMAYHIGHEFGHVVLNVGRRSGRTELHTGYSKFADHALRRNAQRLLYTPMHDPDDLVGFGKLTQPQIREVVDRWKDEIMADLIGVDLARTYHRDHGPGRHIPGIVGFANMAIHIGFIAQLFLYLYLNHRDPSIPLTSLTHPPIDFRMHCIVEWMYPNPQNESVMLMIKYYETILRGVLGG